ncbi:hypothetical protein DFH09DRAFT_1369298 [Mycena vulgaris]|nr:hypothetical protein DFH09DRAFT_1369298 [Mycena vulgaris]
MALLDFIYNRPNRVLALQKQYQVQTIIHLVCCELPLTAFQADPRPIYLRPAGAKATLATYGVLFSLGMMSTLYGIGCLVTGYGKPAPKDA